MSLSKVCSRLGRLGLTLPFMWVLLALLCFGCAQATPTPESPTLTPTPQPTRVPDLLAESARALRGVSSFRTRWVLRQPLPGVSPTTLATSEGVSEYVVGPPELWRQVAYWPDRIESVYVCEGSKCWACTGDHPWHSWGSRGTTYLDRRESRLEEASVVRSGPVAESGEILVEWTITRTVGTDDSRQTVTVGRTWLQAETYLPVREREEVQAGDSLSTYVRETTFYDYDAPVTIDMPVVATVTPHPTLPPRSSFTSSHVEEMPFPGILYVPDGDGPWPAVVVLHGSEGRTTYSGLYASQYSMAGYVAMALCYFKCADTPPNLENIALEGIMDAVDYLKARDDVRPDAVALVGHSRGAELALIVGALDPDVRAVVAVSGSPQVVSGLPSGTAWLHEGKPLPFLIIPVERINGPVLVIHGALDLLWPVDFSYRITDRLVAHEHEVELVVYPMVDHYVFYKEKDATRCVIDFLERSLS